LTQIDFCVKDLSTPASLRSDRAVADFNRNKWPLWIGTTGRIQRNKQDYEVVIDPVTFKVNEEETRKRREKFY